jgi:hypothetical protein
MHRHYECARRVLLTTVSAPSMVRTFENPELVVEHHVGDVGQVKSFSPH